MRYDATKIKRGRLIKGWSQERLAAIADVEQATISNVENGKTNNPETVRRIADALDLRMEDLLIEDEAEKAPLTQGG